MYFLQLVTIIPNIVYFYHWLFTSIALKTSYMYLFSARSFVVYYYLFLQHSKKKRTFVRLLSSLCPFPFFPLA